MMGFNAILKTKRVYMLYFNSGFSRTRRVVVEGNWCVGFAVFVISGIFCCGQI